MTELPTARQNGPATEGCQNRERAKMVIPDPFDDRRMAEAAARGDRGGLAEIYDRYGPYLYDYCRSLLREPATDAVDAAVDATQDVFVAAWVHIGRLRDPERLRPWLYALARGHCLARSADAGIDLPAGPEPQAGEAGFADPSYLAPGPEGTAPGPEGTGTRDLTRRALDGLEGRDREALDLALRHGFGRRGVAAVLGVPEAEAYARVTRARARFEGTVAALMAPGGAEGQFFPATLLADLPLAAPPADMRDRVLHAAFDAVSDAREPSDGSAHDEYLASGRRSEPEYALASQRAHVAAPAFDGRGFPVQPDARPRSARRWALLAGAVVLALTAVGAAGGGLLVTRDGGETERPADTPVLTSPTSLPSLPGGDSAIAPIPAASGPSPTPTATPTEAPSEPAARPQPSRERGRGQTWDSSREKEQPRLTVRPRRVDLGTGSRGSVVLGAKGGAVMWGSSPSSEALSVSPDWGAIPQGGRVKVTITLDRARTFGPGRAFVRFGTTRGQIETVVVVWS